jgi:hypothetical protein
MLKTRGLWVAMQWKKPVHSALFPRETREIFTVPGHKNRETLGFWLGGTHGTAAAY